MIVVSLTDCPPALRGDLSKWLLEIHTGVYVGQVNARVREQLWQRITQNIKSGRAVMVFDTDNEQGMDFRIHNTSWEIVDYDGIQLVRRPSEQRLKRLQENAEISAESGFSNAAQRLKVSRINQARSKGATSDRQSRKGSPPDLTVVDIETTGLDPEKDVIIEIGAVKVRDYQEISAFNVLIRCDSPLPASIAELTGLTDQILCSEGIDLSKGLEGLLSFIDADPLLIHNAAFDMGFLQKSLAQCGMASICNRALDTCMLARKAFLKVPNYRLSTLAEHYGIGQPVQHRALPDCRTTLAVYRCMVQTE